MANSPSDMSLPGRLLVGSLFVAPGIFIELIAVGAVQVDASSVHAPMWVIATGGGMFTITGLWIMTAGTGVGRVLEKVVGPVVLVGLLSMLHWVAFGPGVRQCSGGFSIPFFSARGPVGDLECRAAFGYGALLFDGILAGSMLSSFAKKTLEGRALKVVEGIASALIFIPLLPFILFVALLSLIQTGWEKVRAASGGGTKE